MTKLLLAAALILVAFPFRGTAKTNSAHEEANKKLLSEFLRVVVQARNPDGAKDYVAKNLVQHDPNLAPGLGGLIQCLENEWKGQQPKPVEPTLQFPPGSIVIAKDDVAICVSKRTLPDPVDKSKTYDKYGFTMFRVENGKLVEHWNDATKAPKQPE